MNRETAAAEIAAVATGTPNQQERYAVGLLPEEELLQLARVQLYGNFKFPRWSGRDRDRMLKEFKHGGGAPCFGREKFETTAVGEMNADEWAMFKRMTVAAGHANQHEWLDAAAVSVQPIAHWLTCDECEAELCKISVKVSIAWAGRTLVREYALDAERERDMNLKFSTAAENH